MRKLVIWTYKNKNFKKRSQLTIINIKIVGLIKLSYSYMSKHDTFEESLIHQNLMKFSNKFFSQI